MSKDTTISENRYKWITRINCPSCNGNTLFVANGGYITCSNVDCEEPNFNDALNAHSLKTIFEIIGEDEDERTWGHYSKDSTESRNELRAEQRKRAEAHYSSRTGSDDNE